MSNVTPTSPAVPTTISNLPAAASVTPADLIPIVQNGITKSALNSQFVSTIAAQQIAAGNGISVVTSGGISTVSLAALPSADILVGNGSNIASAVALSGDATLSNSGALTIAANAITNSKLAQMAARTVKVNATSSTANATDLNLSASTLLGTDSSNTMGAMSLGACLQLQLTQLNTSFPITTNSLGSDVTINSSSYFDGPSCAQGTSGAFFASGQVTLVAGSGSGDGFSVKLWDGTTVINSAKVLSTGTGSWVVVSLSGRIGTPAGNIKISVASSGSDGKILFNASGNSMDSTLTVIRIG